MTPNRFFVPGWPLRHPHPHPHNLAFGAETGSGADQGMPRLRA